MYLYVQNNNIVTVTKATKGVNDGQEDRHDGTYTSQWV